jgi:small conductance mechanosensitive channel
MDLQSPVFMSKSMRMLIDLAVRYGPKLLTATVILIVGIIIISRIARSTNAVLTRREMEPPLRNLLVRMMSILLFLLVLMLVLQNLGVEMLPIFASLGVASVGVSLAAQGVLSNVVAGLTIIFTRPYRVGEYVALAGVEGQVKEVTLFSTTLSHYDQSSIVVPNRKIVGDILHNYGKVRQLNLAVSVAYSTDLPQALGVIAQVLRSCPRVLSESAPVVGVTTLAESGIEISVKPWVSVVDYVAAGAEIYQGIVDAFRAARIELPFPQREIKLLSPVQVISGDRTP